MGKKCRWGKSVGGGKVQVEEKCRLWKNLWGKGGVGVGSKTGCVEIYYNYYYYYYLIFSYYYVITDNINF